MSRERLEGIHPWKIQMTPSQIKSAIFFLVAQCLNQLRHLVLNCICKSNIKSINETEGSSKEMVVELYVSIPLCSWRDSRKAQQYLNQNIQFLG
jgi:hypothetical protein